MNATTAPSLRIHSYSARLIWTGGNGAGTAEYDTYERSYRIHVEGKPPLSGSAHPSFRGDPARHDPEDMFLAAITSCHMLSYLALCARRRVRVLAYEDSASGILTLNAPGGARFTAVTLRPVVTLAEGADEGLARELHYAAHHGCFIANSCNVPIGIEATFNTEIPRTIEGGTDT